MRRWLKHPKYMEWWDRCRRDRRINNWNIHPIWVRINKVHKAEILRMRTGKGYSLSLLEDAKRIRGCLSVSRFMVERNLPEGGKCMWR